VLDVYASVQDRDLGGVAQEVDKIVKDARPKLPRGSFIQVRGQIETMRESFRGLAGGILLAVGLVYLVMVINFQSWLDPFIILMALPGAISGIVWSLYITQTTINVPSLMGAIMSIGVATANSILLVTFANQRRAEGVPAGEAALSAAVTRLRPVLMTAGAMILGMLPMSLGLGEGGEQNAPIGRAVIGGLLAATLATLFFVPVIYSLLRGNSRSPAPEEDSELLR
jgi:multidrug efflux pump subunit AcrB